jgi:transposase
MTDSASIAWLGLDAHSQNCVLAHLDDQGIQRRWWRFATGAQALQKYVSAIPATDKRLVLEESNLARWISQLLRPLVQQLVVADPRHNRLISAHPNKHDQRDAFNLARLFRLGEIKTVWQPQEHARAFFRTAAQAYEDAVLRQTRLKLQIKSLFQHWGLFPSGSTVFSPAGRLSWLKQLPAEAMRGQGLLLYTLLDQALQGQNQARRLMVQAGRAFPEIARLRTVPGVGVIGAHLFVAYLAEPTRFASFAQLTRYCRLAIRDRSSDGKPLGFEQLDRQGHGVLKALSYRAWLQATKKKRGPIWEFFQASKKRTGSSTHARLNTQRKILLTLWTLWLNAKEFDDEEFSRPAAIDV